MGRPVILSHVHKALYGVHPLRVVITLGGLNVHAQGNSAVQFSIQIKLINILVFTEFQSMRKDDVSHCTISYAAEPLQRLVILVPQQLLAAHLIKIHVCSTGTLKCLQH